MTRCYYASPKSIELLDKFTKFKWRSVNPMRLSSNMCAATIIPEEWTQQIHYPLLSQYYYIPMDKPSTNRPEVFLEYLKIHGKQTVRYLPAFKYDLDYAVINLPPFIQTISEGIMITEGSISLDGDLIIKPFYRLNSLTVSARDVHRLSFNAQLARDEFISSLKLSGYISGKHPSLTVGSSLTDKILMTSTNVTITPNLPNSFNISASYNSPNSVYELPMNLANMSVEMQMGYKFSGKVTIHPSHPQTMPHWYNNKAVIITSGMMIGAAAVIFAIPSGGASLFGAAAELGGLVGLGAAS